MRSIGFTGTRNILPPEQQHGLAAVLESLKRKGFDTIHHGDCVGADAISHNLAGTLGLLRVSHPPAVRTFQAFCQAEENREPLDYIARNHVIVDESEILVVCPKGPEELRSGTWATVRYARALGRPILLVWPNGKVTTEKGSSPKEAE